MISWIQRNFQQHFKVLFLVLLGGVIIAFVFTIGAMPSSGASGAHRQTRDFFGMNLNAKDDQERIFGDARLSITLQAGYNALDGARLQQYAFNRQAALNLANKIGLPAPTEKSIVEYVQTLRIFQGESGKFDPKAYETFRESLTTNPRITEADVSRVVAEDVIYNQVKALLAGPGYVLPADVTEQLTISESTWSINVTTIDATAFDPTIKVEESELAAFFAENSGRYEIPVQTRVDYIPFPIDGNSVSVSDDELLSTYLANPARFPAPDSAEKKPDAGAFDNFAAVKPQVSAFVRRQKAARVANQAASDLAYALFENKVAPDALPDFLAKQGLSLKSAAPISATNTPPELAGLQQISAASSRLSSKQPYSDALGGPDKAVVLVWRESIPSRLPELAEVHAQVESDYRENLKHERFASAGSAFRNDLDARLKSGAAFANAAPLAAKSAGLKIETKSYAGFTLATPPEGLDYAAINALQSLGANTVSPMVTVSREAALVVHVADKKLPDLTASNKRFDEIKDQISNALASRGGDEALAGLVEAELARTAPEAP